MDLADCTLTEQPAARPPGQGRQGPHRSLRRPLCRRPRRLPADADGTSATRSRRRALQDALRVSARTPRSPRFVAARYARLKQLLRPFGRSLPASPGRVTSPVASERTGLAPGGHGLPWLLLDAREVAMSGRSARPQLVVRIPVLLVLRHLRHALRPPRVTPTTRPAPAGWAPCIRVDGLPAATLSQRLARLAGPPDLVGRCPARDAQSDGPRKGRSVVGARSRLPQVEQIRSGHGKQQENVPADGFRLLAPDRYCWAWSIEHLARGAVDAGTANFGQLARHPKRRLQRDPDSRDSVSSRSGRRHGLPLHDRVLTA